MLITLRLRKARQALAFTSASLCVTLLAVAGCGPTGQAGTMSTALGAYNAQRYAEAHEQASGVMNRSVGIERERAAYLAGISAYQAGDAPGAESALSAAAMSSDPQVAGDAKAMLGQLRLDQRRSREAATCFADASRLLQGEDARQAAWHAGLAYRQAGDEPAAKRWLDMASSAKFDPAAALSATSVARQAAASPVSVALTLHFARQQSAPAPVVAAVKDSPAAARPPSAPAGSGVVLVKSPDDPPPVGFTLQVGAFNEKRRATSAARDADTIARQQSLGRVRVLPRKDNKGESVYLVQVGWWVTREEASAARAKIGRLEYIVTPAAPES